jgi:hypothetical protein
MKDRKRVIFHYDSEPDNGKVSITMSFRDNLVFTNGGQTVVAGPGLDILGYAPDGLPLIAAKECLEEMIALVNAAIETE